MTLMWKRIRAYAWQTFDRAWKTGAQVLVLGAITFLSSSEFEELVRDNWWLALAAPAFGASLSVVSSALSTAVGDRSPTLGSDPNIG